MSRKPSFIYFERPLAKALGLEAKLLRQKRAAHLQRGEDWELQRHCVAYCEPGLELLLFQLQLAQKKADADFALAQGLDLVAVKKAALECPTKPPFARVTKAQKKTGMHPAALSEEDKKNALAETWAKVVRPAMNRRLLACQLGEELIYVAVKDRTKFPPGMKIPVRKKEAGSAWYELTCQEPRRRGVLPSQPARSPNV